MTDLAPKVLLFIAFLYVYIGGIRGRPNILEDTARGENQKTFEESDLLKRSKAKSGGQGKDHKEIKGKKKQVIDAYHLGPYHHGHPWGTVSQWPGFHWGGHPSRHAGWTGYPSLGGWHKSHISKKSPKKAAQKASLKRRMLPTFAFPAYGYAYPSLGFAAVPFTPSPIPWGHAHYRTKVPEKSSIGHTRSSVKHTEANKRWWPGYMGGWGGWGLGNEGYPGWGALGDWGRGYDFGGFGHGWGMLGTGLSYHPFLRAEIPRKQSKKDKAEKRWWPGYMGGWGGWGLGNSGYPGWGPLGGFWGHGWGPYAYGHGYGLGIGRGHAFRSDLPSRDDKEEQSPKRQLIHEPFAGTDFPWSGYGPFADYQYPYFGHSQYIPYPFALYGDSIPFYGFGPSPVLGYGFPGDHGFFKSKIPEGKSEKMQKELKKEEKATGRHFVNNFHPGRMGWGGALYSGNGYHAAFPLLGAHTYGLYGAGFYGPYGPPYGAFGPYSRSGIPGSSKENPQSRQVINYNPGCCGWGGCVYPGCGYIGGWTWPLPCHFRHCGCGCPCWTRSKAPRKQSMKEEKGKSRQDIESPVEEESENGKEDPRTRPHLEGADLLNSEMQSLAMGFPGIEKLQTPMGSSSNQGVQGFNDQEIDANGEHSSPEPAEASESMAGMNPFEGANALRAAAMGSMGEQQDGQQQTAEDLMSTFSTSPSNEGEAPVEAFGETGNPNMYPTEAEEQATEAASRRADIPGEMEKELIKKQAVAYPYHYLYPGFTMAHGVNPYYHYTPLNYPQHVMAYPSIYPLANTYAPLYPPAHAGLIPQAKELPLHDRPSHSIHVGAPNVNVDVHTTREHVAPSPEKVKSGKLKQLFGEFSTKLKPKSRHHQSSHGKKVMKRQISPLLSPIMSRPMGLSPLRYPVSNPQPGLTGARMFPSLQPAQPFDIRAMSRSGLPAMSSPAMGMSPLGFSASRAPQMRSALTPSQMAFSRQLSSVTGISIPIAAQPGMGIVGMASRKKRSPSKKPSKKKDKTTKRQFLAAMPQTLSSGGLPWLSSPESPFSGAAFPSLPFAQPQQRLSFKQPMMPAIRSRMAPTGLTALRMAGLQANRMPMMLSPFSGFPSPQNNPFFKVPQFQSANFFSGSPNGPWAPSTPMREPMSEMPNAPMREPISETSGFSQLAERRPEPMIPETQQMNGEQFAGFNPSSFGLSEPQPPAMFSQEGPGSEGPQLPMVPQKEMASFFQVPGEGAMTESPTFNMQPGLAALKKSSVPDKKNIKGKSSKSRRQITL